MPSTSPVKKQKPLQLDCTALMNHLTLIQSSIPFLSQYQKQFKNSISSNNDTGGSNRQNGFKPNLQMVNFSQTSLSKTNKATNYYEWYILVASTPFAISAQLVPVPKTREGIVEPDLIQCTPISIWTCAETNEYDFKDIITSFSDDDNDNDGGGDQRNKNMLEILNCNPTILIQESSSHLHDKKSSGTGGINTATNNGESLMVSVVMGTTHNRVLCIQLSIFSYVGVTGKEEGRYVLSKTPQNNNGPATATSINTMKGSGNILEPLPLDTDESIRKKIGENSSNGNPNISQSHSLHNNDTQSITSGNAATHESKDTTKESQNSTQWCPFKPTGGVVALSPLYRFRDTNIIQKESKTVSNGDFLWITYGDGTLVRLPRWAFFPHIDDYYDGEDHDLDNRIQIGLSLQDRLVKAMVMINPTKSSRSVGVDGLTILPLPHFFPSLMSQPLQNIERGPTSYSSSSQGYINIDECDDGSGVFSASFSMSAPAAADYEFFEAVSFGQQNTTSKNGHSYVAPTLSFYTNEDQLFSKTHKAAEEEYVEISTVQSIIKGGTSIIGGTAAIAKGMLGGMMGAMLGRSKQIEEEAMKGMEIIGDSNNDNPPPVSSHTLFPSMHEETNKLPLASALFDTPRQIINASIDPVDGVLMACADSLGRVQLIDLSTKQVIRIWKGVRDASCHWIQFPFHFESGPQIVKYLTIHCRERKILEIYRVRHGPRVGKFSTTSDAQVVQCVVALKGGESYTKCFILQYSLNSKRYVAKELMIHDKELNEVVVEASSSSKKSSQNQNEKYLAHHQSLTEGTIQLQLLKQLLGSEIPSDLDVYAALTQITAISDLSKAVDLLAVAPLEEMGIDDSSFHCEVLTYAQEQLDIALSDDIIATSNNPLIDELQSKIDFHRKVRSSFFFFKFTVGFNLSMY